MAHNHTATLARCTERACPVRYPTGGADHPCGEHDQPTVFGLDAVMASYGIDPADLGATAPGDPGNRAG